MCDPARGRARSVRLDIKHTHTHRHTTHNTFIEGEFDTLIEFLSEIDCFFKNQKKKKIECEIQSLRYPVKVLKGFLISDLLQTVNERICG